MDVYSKELKSGSRRDIWIPVFIAALFTVVKMWKQPKCPLTDEWIKEMWYVYMEYYSALKKEEILPYMTTWMNLEGIMLSKIHQVRRTGTAWFHLYEVPYSNS